MKMKELIKKTVTFFDYKKSKQLDKRNKLQSLSRELDEKQAKLEKELKSKKLSKKEKKSVAERLEAVKKINKKSEKLLKNLKKSA